MKRNDSLCRILSVACAAVGVAGIAAAARADDAWQAAAIKAGAAQKIGVRDCSMVRIAVGNDATHPMDVKVELGGKERILHLLPHSVRGPNFHVLEQRADGKTYEVKAPPESTFRGMIDGDAGSVIAGGLMPDGMYAQVMQADGTTYWIQPVAKFAPGAPDDLYGVYTHADVLPGPWHCGNADVPPASHTTSPFAPRGSNLFTAELSTDADFEFFSRYGGIGAVTDRISLVINIMNLQYERETDITHALSTMMVRTAEPDPYTSTDPNTLLIQFRDDWNNNHAASRKDVNELFTGKEMSGSTIGLSYVAVICGTFSYGWAQSDFNNNLMSATDLSAHEIGHNWSASHCTCSGSGSTVSTMNPFITSINRFTFSNNTNTVAEIVAHRNSRGCLTTGAGGIDPPNDLCASAVRITAGTLIGWNNSGAANDGPIACGTITNDTWYFYDAPCDGSVTVTTCGSNFDTFLVAYSGFCGGFTQVACDDDNFACAGGGLTSLITWTATRGTRYLIRAGGFNGNTGDGLISVSQFCSAPANDNCGSATVIGQGSFPFSTNAASTDGLLETTLCNAAGNAQISNDVWFQYVGQCAGTVRLGTCGSFDTKIAVYSGGCPGAPNAAIACNDDNGPACGGLSASVDFTAARGTTYLIRVGGFGAAVGAGTLTVTSLACPAPSNDDCPSALNVSAGGTFNGTNLGAFTDSTACGGSFDVFYFFVAPASGVLTATTCGTNDTGGADLGVDTILSVHTACPANISNQVICNDDWPGSVIPTACTGQDSGNNNFDSAVQTNLTAGQLVYLRVAQFSSAGVSGAVRLNVSFASAGACCCGSTCSVSDSGTCSTSGGFFQGAGVACNVLGNNVTPCCRADFDRNGTVAVQDIFGFLTAWFASNPCVDVNQSGAISVQDIFDFLGDWFAGC